MSSKTDIVNLKAKYNLPIGITGDYNSRTAELSDLCERIAFFEERFGLDELYEQDEDGDIPSEFQSRRHNQDTETNENGTALLNFCRDNGLLIANGRFGADKGIGKITVYNRNGGTSAVDYALASGNLCKLIRDFEVDDFCPLLSDVHCPVILSLGVNESITVEEVEEDEEDTTFVKFTWDDGKQSNFKSNFYLIFK